MTGKNFATCSLYFEYPLFFFICNVSSETIDGSALGVIVHKHTLQTAPMVSLIDTSNYIYLATTSETL